MPTKFKTKHIASCIQQIKHLEQGGAFVFSTVDKKLSKKNVEVIKTERNRYSFQFEDSKFQLAFDLGELHDVTIIGDTFRLNANRIFLSEREGSTIRGDISGFYTEGFSRKTEYFLRLVIPSKHDVRMHDYFVVSGYEPSPNSFQSGLLSIRIADKEFELFRYSRNKKAYIVVDSFAKMSVDKFAEYCYSILVCFGFVTGNFPQDEGYFFTYSSPDAKDYKHVYYLSLIKSMRTNMVPFSRNPHQFIKSHDIAEQIKPTLSVLNQTQFSNLCSLAHGNPDFSEILHLIIESCGASLHSMAVGFSVALENLTKMICNKHEDTTRPISDEQLATNIKRDIMGLLAPLKDAIGNEGYEILKKKIQALNQPTNADKLIKPFKLYNFTLAKEDKDAIKHRNTFLHGRIFLYEDLKGDNDKAVREIYHVTVRLYTLLSVLILKQIGFNGNIINYPKVHEDFIQRPINENYIRQLQ